ncbi:septal ring lytic transglycosylase RlpA family protein [Brucella gallinifaecis]|uniref:Endolytic peptidoglycan transglycosylase RlpA n=1 Tax=Brucella gallinifaecis TaxID=215590 RepID=A0A502BPL0_9HYPH|nr:septal ring lytic transglycosylase RlpA family protein [Brucella gallinifaecis]TPF75581.1 septal ring lytic transglycosylase RlpA family protein [Brucella gallinifaecis]
MKFKIRMAILAVATTGLFSVNAMEAQAARCGSASWYALTSRTASGERMNPAGLTAAHKTLPLGTKVKVTNQRNGKSLVVRINDRGPFIKGRILDLSKGAALRLGFINSGHTNVCFTPL